MDAYQPSDPPSRGSIPDGPPQTPRDADAGVAAPVAALIPPVAPRRSTERRCAECGQTFAAASYNQLFCSTPHQRAFHKRQERRGAALLPLAMAARLTRDGTEGDKATGKAARRDSRQLISLWAAEDKAAGRLSMVDYVAARYRLGILGKLDA